MPHGVGKFWKIHYDLIQVTYHSIIRRKHFFFDHIPKFPLHFIAIYTFSLLDVVICIHQVEFDTLF